MTKNELHTLKHKLKLLIKEVLSENWSNWSLIIDKTGKIHDCGIDHNSWMISNWKPKSMAPGYKINVQGHGDDPKTLFVDERANTGIFRKKLVAFAQDNNITYIVWVNNVTNRGRTEEI